MSRPALLDLFCCEGGAAEGYCRAGFELYGVDHEDQPLYPFWFHKGDALKVLDTLLRGIGVEFRHRDGRTRIMTLAMFAAVHASPPCQALSTITPDKSKHVNLIPDVRARLQMSDLPYVIENVEGARKELRNPIRLCGSAFDLKVRRHRLFESSVLLEPSVCDHKSQGQVFGVYGSHGDKGYTYKRPDGSKRGQRAHNAEHARELMGMPWASWHGCTQAIPPAMTEFIGGQLIRELAR